MKRTASLKEKKVNAAVDTEAAAARRIKFQSLRRGKNIRLTSRAQ